MFDGMIQPQRFWRGIGAKLTCPKIKVFKPLGNTLPITGVIKFPILGGINQYRWMGTLIDFLCVLYKHALSGWVIYWPLYYYQMISSTQLLILVSKMTLPHSFWKNCMLFLVVVLVSVPFWRSKVLTGFLLFQPPNGIMGNPRVPLYANPPTTNSRSYFWLLTLIVPKN